jgi:hypothetical protein
MARPIKKYQKGGKLPKRKPKPGEKGGRRVTQGELRLAEAAAEREEKFKKRKRFDNGGEVSARKKKRRARKDGTAPEKMATKKAVGMSSLGYREDKSDNSIDKRHRDNKYELANYRIDRMVSKGNFFPKGYGK